MRRTTIINPKEARRITYKEGAAAFFKHCALKNLRPPTIRYYKEDLNYFQSKVGVKHLEDITQEVFDGFILDELNEGKKVSSLNSRIRGLRVFFNFCAEREYMTPLALHLMKEDVDLKEPYTDAELRRLLKKPRSKRWVEWRSWASINYLLATGNRASTVINIRIEDIDFEEMTIRLRMLKNRKQQIMPLSPALKEVLTDYLNTWVWKKDDYLFPSYEGGQLNIRSFQCAISRYNLSRGVSKTSIHLFRHTFAKNYVLAGGGLVQLQGLLGHSTLDMARHYVNIYGTDLNQDFEKFNPLDNLKKRL